MQIPLDIGTKEIDASQIAAIRPNTAYDQDRMVTALGIARARAAEFTARITMLDNTTHNVEGLDVAQVVDALRRLGLRFVLIDKDNVAIRSGEPTIPVTYHPFGKGSDMPEEERRYFSEVRIGRSIRICAGFSDIGVADGATCSVPMFENCTKATQARHG